MFLIRNPRPWKLPAPFVGPTLTSFLSLILLAAVNGIYPRLNFCGRASIGFYVTNLVLILSISGLFFSFASLRYRNFTYNHTIIAFALIVVLAWVTVLLANASFLLAGFLQCRVPRLQKGDLQFCHFFGNPELARAHGWDGDSSGDPFNWVTFAASFVVITWQIINWQKWRGWAKQQTRNRELMERSQDA